MFIQKFAAFLLTVFIRNNTNNPNFINIKDIFLNMINLYFSYQIKISTFYFLLKFQFFLKP